MPCADGRDYRDDYSAVRDELDKVTELLCGLCGRLEFKNQQGFIGSDRQLEKWWREHQRMDRERIAREQEKERKEQLKQNALNKLTKEERALLGIR